MLKTLDFEGNGREMGALILKDLGLTSRILRLGNSAMFNRSGRPILSVAHAMVLLGWDRIRNLMSTVRFVEHFVDRSARLPS
jgi:HD-like signal output (HDOD) protein